MKNDGAYRTTPNKMSSWDEFNILIDEKTKSLTKFSEAPKKCPKCWDVFNNFKFRYNSKFEYKYRGVTIFGATVFNDCWINSEAKLYSYMVAHDFEFIKNKINYFARWCECLHITCNNCGYKIGIFATADRE